MEIRYTFHAKIMLKERKIQQVWVEETIKSPNKSEREFGKYYARKKLNGKSIEVVYMKEKYIKVITAYWI